MTDEYDWDNIWTNQKANHIEFFIYFKNVGRLFNERAFLFMEKLQR